MLAVLLALVALVVTVPALREQASLSLSHRRTPFAALSFTDASPPRICDALRAGSVQFAVRNVGPQRRSFDYEVTLLGRGTDRLALPGTVDVAADSSGTATVAVPVRARGAREVDVRLTGADLSVRVSCERTTP